MINQFIEEQEITLDVIRKELEQRGGSLRVMTVYPLYNLTNETIAQYLKRTAQSEWERSNQAEPVDLFISSVEDKIEAAIPKIAARAKTLNHFMGQLTTTIKRRCIDTWRSSKVRKRVPSSDQSEDRETNVTTLDHYATKSQHQDDETPEVLAMQREREHLFTDLLKELTPQERDIYQIHYVERLTLKQAAERMGTPKTKIYRYHTNLLRNLRDLLKQKGINSPREI